MTRAHYEAETLIENRLDAPLKPIVGTNDTGEKLAYLTVKSWQQWRLESVSLIEGFVKLKDTFLSPVDFKTSLLPVHYPAFFRATT